MDTRFAMTDAIATAFGENAPLALDLYAQYCVDPGSVGESWRASFSGLERGVRARLTEEGAGREAPAVPSIPRIAEPAPPRQLPPAPEAAAPAPSAPRFTPPAPRPGDEVLALAGAAATIARNMEASLAIPTATSQRVFPVKTMEENRRVINQHRELKGQTKVSFTHLVAWAVVKALKKHPVMNDAYGEQDGKPVRIRKGAVNFGVAVDVTKRDGSRSLLVPNIKNVESMNFGEFLAAYDQLIGKARKGTLDPDAYANTTISLTNPGTLGTTASAPRLMPGQGTILATGVVGYPAEYQALPEQLVASLGISRVITLTSTYDHRIIQGAESGSFLATVQELLLGSEEFYERLFADLRIPHRPIRWETDKNPPFFRTSSKLEAVEKQARILPLINFYRVRGHLIADLDPLGKDSVRYHAELDPATFGYTIWDLDRIFITNGLGGTDQATLREILEVLRETYCAKIGAEFMNIQDPVQKSWLMDRMESCRNKPALDGAYRRRILSRLIEAESFEKFLHAKYVGHKRFSLEGGEAAIPLLTRLLDRAAENGAEEIIMGMPHRGRLTVLTTVVKKPVQQIFAEFEEVPDLTFQGSGDVKYHLGATGIHEALCGSALKVAVSPNPSHLEFVDPVVEGMVRAKQERCGDTERMRVWPVLIHGDAAFAGQGIVAETFNMCELDGYRTGGTIHIVVNNQIGFTTDPDDARSTPYCTDVAKMVQAPIFHVNGDDPEAVMQAVDLAVEYRKAFRHDVVIDMVCYRRYGHNEGDEPSYTQPLLYQKIKNHASIARLYGESLAKSGVVTQPEIEALWDSCRKELETAYDKLSDEKKKTHGIDSLAAPPAPRIEVTESAREILEKVIRAISTVPDGFELHPKLRPLLKRRAEFGSGRPEIDWAGAEALAFGKLLLSGTPVRLSGQDSGRGTFSHRHAVLDDYQTGKEITLLNHLGGPQARFDVIDSLLSENAVMGFEFGYAIVDPSTLVLWEAQFGDFANGGQVIIDQFISGSEQKWGQRCGLVLLLPHGQEGQGPEHSSARLERFLTLCAEDNLRVANLSTPAQYHHALLRQMAGETRKPLILMSPKSLLRSPKAVSSIDELLGGTFRPVLDDPEFQKTGRERVRRVVIASGKVIYELIAAREKHGRDDVAIVRLEEFYPFPGELLGQTLCRYPQAAELVYVQEEPRNMGAWRFVREQFLDGLVSGVPAGRALRYIGRRPLASPAPGSHFVFQVEQDALLAEAVRVEGGRPGASGTRSGAEKTAAVS
ncbi:MAG: Multifunctional 2-oxoglutarate metabolism enzyme [Thermoanaerobaculia bacterium]|nr:Multifunctional 2-oxoglutarate metabolism enzyme [Thermoanaerobaculia bacterium]